MFLCFQADLESPNAEHVEEDWPHPPVVDPVQEGNEQLLVNIESEKAKNDMEKGKKIPVTILNSS